MEEITNGDFLMAKAKVWTDSCLSNAAFKTYSLTRITAAT